MKLKILLVDDDLAMREVLTESLVSQSKSIEVISAKDPIDAIDKFHELKNTLTHVVVDYYMPRENGLEFCKLVKSSHKGIVVILFSGDSELEKLADTGFVDIFFSKDRPKKLISYILNR